MWFFLSAALYLSTTFLVLLVPNSFCHSAHSDPINSSEKHPKISEDSEIRVRLTSKGAEYTNAFKSKLFQRAFAQLYQLRDFDENINWIENPAVIYSKNASVTKFKPAPIEEYTMDPDIGFSRRTKGGSLVISGTWQRKAENDPKGPSEKIQYYFGTYSVELGSTFSHFTAQLQPKNGADGGIGVNMTHCHIGEMVLVRANVTSDPTGLPADLTRKYEVVDCLLRGHKPNLEKSFCTWTKQVLAKGTETIFGTFPISKPWPGVDNLTVTYHPSSVGYTNETFDMFLKGSLKWNGEPMRAEGKPKLPELPEDWKEHMMIVQISDQILNSQFDIAYSTGLLKRTITNSDLGTKGQLLSTTCSTLCIGKFSKQLQESFPNRFINLAIEALAPVIFTTNQNGTKFEGRGQLRMFLPANKKVPEKELIHGLITISGKLTDTELKLGNGTEESPEKELYLKSKMKLDNFEISETTSTLSDLQGVKLEKLAKVVTFQGGALMSKYLKRHFGGGIPLPMSKAIKVVKEPKIYFADNGINVGVDFRLGD